MKKIVFLNSFIATSIIFICASPVFANWSPVPVRDPIPLLPSIVLLDFASDTCFILISLLILGQIGKHRFGVLLKVCLLAMVAGFTADAIGIAGARLLAIDNIPASTFFIAIVISIILIAVANYNFGRYYFKLNSNQSLIMGIIMGIFTMPVGILSQIPIRISHNTMNAAPPDPYQYTVIGTVFAFIDIILLYFIRPLAPISRLKIAVIGLIITVCASAYCLLPIKKIRNEDAYMLGCGINMKFLSESLYMYAQEYGDYPPRISAVPMRLIREAKCLHCKLDKNYSTESSYEYRKPPAYILHPDVLGIIRCPLHPFVPYVNQTKHLQRQIASESSECESWRNVVLSEITRFKQEHGSFPSTLDELDNDYTMCRPSHTNHHKDVRYIYKKPPDNFVSSDYYWILRCTHHPDYDVYMSVPGTFTLKALPKGEVYR